MRVTLGDKLGADFDKLRLQLPNQPEAPQPVVGVVVPDAVPRTPTKPDRIDLYYMGHTPGVPGIDEGQLVGELLSWLLESGLLYEGTLPGDLLAIQQKFFQECDR